MRTVQERWIGASRRNDGVEHVSDERFTIRLPQMMLVQQHKDSTRPPRKWSLSLYPKYIILAMTKKTGQVIL